MDFELTDDRATIRAAVAELAGTVDDQYWTECDRDHRVPSEFYDALATGGRLGITTPEEYGGHGFGISAACLVLEARTLPRIVDGSLHVWSGVPVAGSEAADRALQTPRPRPARSH